MRRDLQPLDPMQQLLSRGLLAAVLAAPAAGHDFWLAPSSAHISPGEVLAVTASIGHADDPELYARNPAHIRRFEALGPAVDGVPLTTPLVGLDGKLPTGRAALHRAGLHAVVYQSNPSGLTMAADSFEDYLREEGLDWVVAERARLGESGVDGVESYVRCAKALVHVGSAPGQPLDRATGLPLELVAEFDAAGHPLAPDGRPGALSVRLLFEGQPAAGVLVSAHGIGADAPVVEGRTDAEGRVGFRLPRGGAWYFSAVRMRRAAPEASVDWQSWWASLRVELPAAPPVAGPSPASAG